MTAPVLEIDEVVVVLLGGLLVAGPPVPEFEALDDAFALEKFDRAIDGRERDAVVDRGGAAVQFDHVGVILRLVEDARDHAALARHPQAARAARPLDGADTPPGRPLHCFRRHRPLAQTLSWCRDSYGAGALPSIERRAYRTRLMVSAHARPPSGLA